MVHLKSIEAMKQTGNAAVRRLRKQKFAKGLPFMINSRDLPQNESYLEYPDGRMVIIKSQVRFIILSLLRKYLQRCQLTSADNFNLISHAGLIYHYWLQWCWKIFCRSGLFA